MTTVVIFSNEQYLVLEVRDPYDTATSACSDDASTIKIWYENRAIYQEMGNPLRPIRD